MSFANRQPKSPATPPRLRVMLVLASLCSTSISLASDHETYGNVAVNEVDSIYDADTITVTIKEWPPIIGKRIPIRVAGIDAPELRGKCAQEIQMARRAKQHVVMRLRSAKRIELRNIARDKFFRINAEVFVDGASLADELIAKDLARSYEGGRRQSWCGQ